MQATRFKALKEVSLRTKVVNELKEAIFSGRLQPGEALPELKLAREFQVSQATVREALNQLEVLGLIERVENRRSNVTKFSPEEMTERSRIRAVLEGMALVEAAERMGEDHYGQLEALIGAFREADRQGDVFGRIRADFEIHRFLWRLSGNATLQRMLEHLTNPLFAYISILRAQGYVRAPVVTNPHEDLVVALRTKDATRIKESIQKHIEPSVQSFLQASQLTDKADLTKAKRYGS